MFYGFPILPSSISHDGYQGLKFAHHFKGEETDPNNVDRRCQKTGRRTFRGGKNLF